MFWVMRAWRSSLATTMTCAPSTPSASIPYSPKGAANPVVFPFPAGMLTSPWRGRGSSSRPWMMVFCHGRGRILRRAPVPLGTVTYRSMNATALEPPRLGRRRKSSGGAVTCPFGPGRRPRD